MTVNLPTIVSECWKPNQFHGLDGAARRWKLTNAGILIRGEKKERRTRGRPATLTRIKKNFAFAIRASSFRYDIPERVIAAVIATESGGRLPADRYERKIKDWSFGLMQTLTRTARGIGSEYPEDFKEIDLPRRSVPGGGDKARWKELLDVPMVSIKLGTAYLRESDFRLDLQRDPVLLYVAYNAGSPRRSSRNPWGLVYHGRALDHFVAWYGDACAVFKESC